MQVGRKVTQQQVYPLDFIDDGGRTEGALANSLSGILLYRPPWLLFPVLNDNVTIAEVVVGIK